MTLALLVGSDAKPGLIAGFVEQTGLAVLSEAAVQYCRVVFDLFPDEALVRVLLVGSDRPRWLNSWEQQSLPPVISGLSDSNPTPNPDLGAALTLAVEELKRAPAVGRGGTPERGRIMILSQDGAVAPPELGKVSGLRAAVASAMEGGASSALRKCDVSLLKAHPGSHPSQVAQEPIDPSAKASAVIWDTGYTEAVSHTMLLAQRHLHLGVAVVKDIPLKEKEEKEPKSATNNTTGVPADTKHMAYTPVSPPSCCAFPWPQWVLPYRIAFPKCRRPRQERHWTRRHNA